MQQRVAVAAFSESQIDKVLCGNDLLLPRAAELEAALIKILGVAISAFPHRVVPTFFVLL